MSRPALVLIVAMLSAFGLIASDVYLPAMPTMADGFGIADWQMPQSVSVYLLVLACAQLGYGPLSDRFGRKPVLLAGIVLYIAGSLGCAAATGFRPFLVWRMVEALGAAAGLVIGRAIIADTCDKRASAKVYAIVYPLVSLSPALAPAVGGYLAAAWGWRADFLFVAGFGAIALLLSVCKLKETRVPAPGSHRAVSGVGGFSGFSGFAVVLRERSFRCYTVIVCAIYCAWFVYLTQAPFLFARLGVSETASGWLYLPLTCGIVLANLAARSALDRWHYDTIVAAGITCFVIGGLGFTVAGLLPVHGVMAVVAVVLPMCFVSLANGSSLSLAVSGAIAGDHGHAASASGLVGFCQIGSAALASMAISARFGTGSSVLAASVLGFALLAAAAVLTLHRHGHRATSPTAH